MTLAELLEERNAGDLVGALRAVRANRRIPESGRLLVAYLIAKDLLVWLDEGERLELESQVLVGPGLVLPLASRDLLEAWDDQVAAARTDHADPT